MAGVKKISLSLAVFFFAFVLLGEFCFNEVEGTSCAEKTNTSCSDCTGLSSSCYWCSNNHQCGDFKPEKHKNQRNCQGDDVYYKQCYLSSKLLIIILPCVGVAVLLIIGCLIYCCCCRRCRGGKDKFEKEDKKLKKERSERRQIYDHRKAEREARNEEIRMKYGLKPAASGESRYQRLGENYP